MSSARLHMIPVLCALPLWAAACIAADDTELAAEEADALALPVPGESSSPSRAPVLLWQGGGEAAYGYDQWEAETFSRGTPPSERQRVSAHLYIDRRFDSDVHAVFADRIDVAWRSADGGPDSDDVAHTLKEAYLSIGGQERFLDLGRFNERLGVAYSFNPTDFGRRNTIVARPSEDPALVRSDRLGKVGLRAQFLWSGGSLLAGWSPRLRREPSSAPLSPYLERSNSDDEYWLRVGRRVGAATQIEGLAYYTPATGVAAGLNVSTLIGEQLVLFGEVLATPEAGLVERAMAVDPAAPYAQPLVRGSERARAALGASYSPTARFTAVLEWDYDGTALDAQEWEELANPVSLPTLQRYLSVRRHVLVSQDNLARQYGFLHLSLRDPLGPDTSISAFSRVNIQDHSIYHWLQLSRDFDGFSMALTVAHSAGRARTEFGDVEARNSAQLVISKAL